MKNRLGDSTTGDLRLLRQTDLYLARLFAALTVALHLSGLVWRQVRYLNSELAVLASQTVNWLLTFMALALLIAAASLWSRKVKGLVTSTSALFAVGVGYVFWYLISWQDLRSQASNPYYKQHPEAMTRQLFGFVEAKWWDIVILTLVLVLLLWELKTLYLISSFRTPASVEKKD